MAANDNKDVARELAAAQAVTEKTILKLPCRLLPRPLPDVTQLCKLSLPAQPELSLVLTQLQHSHPTTDQLYKLMVHSRYYSDRYRVSST